MWCRRVILAIVFCFAASARANVNIGDTPKIQFTAADGTKIDLAQLKGKIVIVDMWATWCGPCMAEAAHMVQINQSFGGKGLQMIGISLDQDKAQMLAIAREKGFTWPQYFDGLGWQNKFAVQFGVQGIPYTMLIGPEGTVLWSGHPAEIDEPLAAAFKDHPPQLVDPAVLAAANDTLAKVDAELKAHDAKGAIAMLAKLPPAASADPMFAAKALAAQTAVASAAEQILAEVQPLIDSKQYPEAVTKLKQLSGGLSGTPSGDKARKMLSDLLRDPDAKHALNEHEKQANAAAALETAQKLQAQKNDALAYSQFKQIVASFPGTDAAATAAQSAAAYEQDTALMAKINSESQGRKAKSLLSMAKTYAASGQNDLAAKKCQQVIAQFPNTDYARDAQQILDGLQK